MQCRDIHSALMQAVPEAMRETIDYFRDQRFDKQDLYQEALDFMAKCLEDVEPPVGSSPVSRQAHPSGDCISSFSLAHLPPIKIPPFSGSYDKWESFRDRFTSLIMLNKDLSPFARMHFLSSSLTGRALESIQNLPITADNFDIAWNTLVSRYENKRRLVEMHVSTLFDLPPVSRESALDLNELRDKANRVIASLRNLGRAPEDILSDILVFTVSQKLDHATRKAWKLKGGDDPSIPKYEDLDRFLASRARALEDLSPFHATKTTRSHKITSANASVAPSACPLCKADHFINKCAKFIKKSPHQRLETVNQANRCTNCLSAKHAVRSCPSRFSCRECHQRHHSMLHIDAASSSSDSAPQTASNSQAEARAPAAITTLCATSNVEARPPVLLATARVTVSSPAGRHAVVRALIDQGSEVTFISDRLSQILKVRRLKMPIAISAIGCVDAGTCRFAAVIHVSPSKNSLPVLTTTASILKTLTQYSPSHLASHIQWRHIADLTLADPEPFSAEPIDIIIGADLYGELLLEGVRRDGGDRPTAQNTVFGWVISGPTSGLNQSSRSITVQHFAGSISLHRELRHFWEVEEILRQSRLTPEEQRCEEHFTTTHSRRPDGRYVVRLPFKTGPPLSIGESHEIAKRLYRNLRRRLERDSELSTEYTAFLNDYERFGHMRRVPSSAMPGQCVYIPHHPVIRDDSATAHLRVVFNASSLTTNATSLNDHMLTGSKLQTDLAAVILRWRQFRYVYSADIEKMYRQILVDPRDVDYQRILWTDNNDNLIQAYQLLTVTYGTASAPFLALRVLRQLIRDEGGAFPLAVQVLQDHIYVDDVLFGADEVPLLRQIRDQARCALLGRGKFALRKWSSNSVNLLSDLDNQNHGLACSKSLQDDERLKILGIRWNSSLDVFQFRTALPPAVANTKRSILSTVAKVFDPLGWSTPVTVAAKIFVQQLWLLKLDWDEIIPSHLFARWESIRSSLTDIHDLPVDRWTRQGSDMQHCYMGSPTRPSQLMLPLCTFES